MCREIGRAIIQALFFWFDVAQHHPRCQSKQGHSGYDDLFEKVFAHGYLDLLQKRRAKDSSHRNSAKQYEPTHTFG